MSYDTLDIEWGTDKQVRVVMLNLTDPDVADALDWFPGESYGVEYFAFADGTPVDDAGDAGSPTCWHVGRTCQRDSFVRAN